MAVSTIQGGKEVPSSSSKNVLDSQSKKILRYLDDTSKRLDDYTGRCNTVVELFSSAGAPLILRCRLKDLVWRALRAHGTGCSDIVNKALELGWRKIYYEPIHVARRLKKRGAWNHEDAVYVESHLINGIGHYHAVIAFIRDQVFVKNDKECESIQDDLDDVLDSRGSIQTTIVNDYGFESNVLDIVSSKRTGNSSLAEVNNTVSKKPDDKWKRDALHRCFTALGDLSRYRIEFEDLYGEKGNKQAAIAVANMYYNDALIIDPSNGMPFNQLAALAVNQNYGIDSVYYYLRCLGSKLPFKGCEANLQNLFQQNTNRINKLETRHNDDESENISPKEACERSVMYLLRLVQELIFEDSTKRLSQYCQKALQHVQKCLYLPYSAENYEQKEEEEDRSSVLSNVNQSLSSGIACKMVILLLLAGARLKGDTQETKLSMIKAYLLALFSHFVTKLLGDAYFCIFGPESMTELFLNEAEQITAMEKENEDIDINDSEENDDPKTPEPEDNKSTRFESESSRKKSRKKKFHDVLRRKRKTSENDSSNLSYSSHESIASTSSASDDNEDSDENLRHFKRKKRPAKPEGSRSGESKGDDSDSELSSFYSDEEDGKDRFLSSDELSDADKNQEENYISGEESDNVSDEGDDVVVESATDIFSGPDLVKFMSQHHLVPAIRLAFLWLIDSENLVREAGESSSILWFRLSKLFNMLPVGPDFTHEKFLPNSQITTILGHIFKADDTINDNEQLNTTQNWKKRPMPEDWISKSIDTFQVHQSRLEWDVKEDLVPDHQDKDEIQQGLLRILQFNDFCDWLTTIPQTRMTIKEQTLENSEHREGRVVYLKASSQDSTNYQNENSGQYDSSSLQNLDERNPDNDGLVDGSPMEDNDNKSKKAMMQNMAQLWLQQEVKDLEMGSRVTTHRTYLVVDHWALVSHLNLVKDVVDSRTFIVIIPSSTIQQLDDMKRRNNEAREAIRWLERQFQKGNRWLRPQKSQEKKLVDRLAYPKRKQREDWYLIKIVECCNYFTNMTTLTNSKTSENSQNVKMNVTWITSSESGILDNLETSLEGVSSDNKIEENKKAEANDKGSIFKFLKQTAGESLQFENVKTFVEDHNITRPKMSKNSQPRHLPLRAKTSRDNARTSSSRPSHRKSRSDTDGSDNCAHQRTHRRYRIKKPSTLSVDSKSEKLEESPNSVQKDNRSPDLE